MSEREAQELVAKADKKATSSSWFFGGNKYEEAAELYTNAGNIFKMAKRCKPLFHAHIGSLFFSLFFLGICPWHGKQQRKARYWTAQRFLFVLWLEWNVVCGEHTTVIQHEDRNLTKGVWVNLVSHLHGEGGEGGEGDGRRG